jgi:hypothetical protein
LIIHTVWGYISSLSIGPIIFVILTKYGFNIIKPLLNISLTKEIEEFILKLLPEYIVKQYNQFKDNPYIQKGLKILTYLRHKSDSYKLESMKNFYYKDMILKDNAIILRKSYLDVPKEFSLALKEVLREKVYFIYDVDDNSINIQKKNSALVNTIFYIENYEIKIKSGNKELIEYIHKEQTQLNNELDKLLVFLNKDPTYPLIYYLKDSSDDIKIINDKFDYLTQLKQTILRDEMLGIKPETAIDTSQPKSDQLEVVTKELSAAELRRQKVLSNSADRMKQIMGQKIPKHNAGKNIMNKSKLKKNRINNKCSKKKYKNEFYL